MTNPFFRRESREWTQIKKMLSREKAQEAQKKKSSN
jgi:hypothetical protein